jgi:CheY-like chemotaxis protein
MKRKSVLVVDDNLDLLELLGDALLVFGWDVRTAPTVERALAAIESFEPDLILLDVQMPGMTGPELLDMLQAEKPRLLSRSCVVYTSAGDPPDDPRANGFIDKMTELGDYARKIQDCLREKEKVGL